MRAIRAGCAVVALACAGVAARAQDDEPRGEEILEARITLALEKVTVRSVVEAVAEKTGMQYMGVDEALDMERTVSLNIRGRPVSEVLEFLEERLGLDLDFGRLEDTGVLIVALREPEEGGGEGEEEAKEEFAPQLEHAEALEMIRALPAVARLVKNRPGLVIDIEWDADERRWEADLRLGDDDIGRVELNEFDEGRPRIEKVEIRHDLPGPVPEPQKNF